MENFKYIILFILSLIVGISSCRSQSTYQKYDTVTRGAEYNLAKSQMESNKKQIQLLEAQKQSLSLKKDSIIRSRIQGVVSAKVHENFRLGQKAFLLMDANKYDNYESANAAFETLRPRLEYNR